MIEQEAVKIANAQLEGSTITRVQDFGELFAVYFVNDEFYKSNDISDMMIGAGPMFIEKSTGKVFQTGSGQSAEMYAAAYKVCGDLYARPSNSISISGIEGNDELKDYILKLKAIYACSMTQAKEIVSSVASGNDSTLTFSTATEAENALTKLVNLGFVAKQLWNNQC
tara:strand:+ start:483 stop:986 length:504 start_codon:yes stop_codon:yes gene_type:complete